MWMAVKRRRKRDTKRELVALFIPIFHLFIAMFHTKTRLKPRVTRCTLEDENIKYHTRKKDYCSSEIVPDETTISWEET